jgi:hypothetical protein
MIHHRTAQSVCGSLVIVRIEVMAMKVEADDDPSSRHVGQFSLFEKRFHFKFSTF